MTRLDLIEEFENETELPATWSNGGMGGYTEEYTKWLEQRLVKNLTIPVVSQQRELLFAFDEYWNKNNCDGENFCDVVDRFLENNSC